LRGAAFFPVAVALLLGLVVRAEAGSDVDFAPVLVARFAIEPAPAGFATFFAAFRSAMGAPYPRDGAERTYVPAGTSPVSSPP
jgi:hypothetical protein